MQYPIPPWRDPRRFGERRTHLGAGNPRYRHLPLVTGAEDGSVVVLRGSETDILDAIAASSLEGDAEQQRNHDRLFREDVLGEPFFAVANRLGRVRFVSARGLTFIGQVEHYQYSEPYEVSPAVSQARTFDALRDALSEELTRVQALSNDGWELTDPYDDGGPALLVDTRRPDETLRKQDLP